ncbi:Cell division protein ftsQ [gamma proteobacterium IMCC1989]|nr:Cell division protein ftsQ [gamma proteobacterium IMCC1989]
MTKINKRIVKKETVKRTFSFAKVLRVIRTIVFASIFLSVLGVAGFYGTRLATDFLSRPVASITVKGEFNYVAQNEVTELVKGMIGGSFIGEDISEIKQSLESKPWIDSVNLVRQWPDILEIVVHEQVPIARWGESGFVNVRGEIIVVEKMSDLSQFSTLLGQSEDVGLIMQQYSLLATTLQPYNMSVDVLEKNYRGVWRLQLNNGWKVIVGRGDVYKKIQRLTYLLDVKKLNDQMKIKSIDLRYPNGLAVSWIENVTDKEKEQAANLLKYPTIGLYLVNGKQYARG